MRALIFALETAILLALSILTFITLPRQKSNARERCNVALVSVFSLLITISAYLPQMFFGSGAPVKAVDFSFTHRIMLYAGILIPLAVYYILRPRSKQVKEYAMIYIALATLITFSKSYLFKSFTRPNSLPLHLCNTAMYIVPICLIFKLKKLFYFTYFINVLGAFLAMLMPDYATTGILHQDFIIYWVNHICAFGMPLLAVAFGLFERPKLREFRYSMIAFAVYFAVILFINAWFLNYGSVDYFFLNSDFIADKLGAWAENTRNIVWSFSLGSLTFTFYPLYQFLFFVVYAAAGVGMWFLYVNLYRIDDAFFKMLDDYKALRHEKSKFRIAQALTITTAEDNQEMIKITNLRKKYGSGTVYAVDGVNLTVNDGEIFGFLGPNGAGKSTIIKSVVGIQPVTEGSIEICGYDVDKESVKAKMNIGFVPDHYALYENLTGREYINYVADLYEVSKEDRDLRIENFVKLFELAHAFDNPMRSYSHGMKQKIAIIAALIHNPRVWILDEPLTGLDPTSIYEVKETMKKHAREGNVVFFSSHIIDVVERICDRIAIIKKGKIVAEKTIKEIEQSGVKLEDFYLSFIEGDAASNG